MRRTAGMVPAGIPIQETTDMTKTLIALFSVLAFSLGAAHAQTAPAAGAPKKEEAKKCDPKTDKNCKEEKKS
jgi:hypothetical protein